MSNIYPQIFNQDTLSIEEKELLNQFQMRREKFNHFINSQNIKNTVSCPSCGYPSLSSKGDFEICIICDWEDEDQDDPKADEIRGGPNSDLSLTESRLLIGKKLQELCRIFNLKPLSEPEKIIETLNNRQIYIRNFRKNIKSNTTIDDPIMQQYNEIYDQSALILLEPED